jgi:hypothetical protein
MDLQTYLMISSAAAFFHNVTWAFSGTFEAGQGF